MEHWVCVCVSFVSSWRDLKALIDQNKRAQENIAAFYVEMAIGNTLHTFNHSDTIWAEFELLNAHLFFRRVLTHNRFQIENIKFK